jgi:hypothetical protein
MLTGNGIVESLLSKMASLIWCIQDLIVENGEVQGKTKTDWVRGRQLGLGNLSSSLVSLQGLISGVLSFVTNGEFGEVAVVVALPMCALA